MSDNQTELDRVADVLSAQSDIRLAFVFGSVASGRAGADSDLDLAVLAARPLDADRKSDLIRTIAEVTGRPVDLIDLQTSGAIVSRRVLEQGLRLVSRDESAIGELLFRTLIDAADFLPYRERMLRERRQAWTG